MAPKKRESIPLSTKQEALRLLGFQSDGSKGLPLLREQTGKPHTPSTVSQDLHVPRTALYNWKKHAADIMKVSLQAAKKIKAVKSSAFPMLESALITYMLSAVPKMKGTSVFREAVVKTTAANIRDRMVSNINQKLFSCAEEEKGKLLLEKKKLLSFKASTGWFYGFSKRHNLESLKPVGDSAILDATQILAARGQIKQKLCTWSIRELLNTDEVGVLFRSLPSRSFNTNQIEPEKHLFQDQLTAILSIFADGTKAPLTIIGKSSRPQSFPRRFNPVRDLGVFYFAQKNAWNTQQLWTQQVSNFNNTFKRQFRNVMHIVDNCSAHFITQTSFSNMESSFFPQKMTSVLQPVDASVGRSFKAAYRRLLVNHALTYVESQTAEELKHFSINKAVTIYDGVKMMAAAWDLVPKCVVIRSWLQCDILAPHQTADMYSILSVSNGDVERAKRPFQGTLLPSDRVVEEIRATEAKRLGQEFMEKGTSEQGVVGVDHMEQNVPDADVEATEWIAEIEEEIVSQIKDLEDLRVIEDVDVSFFKQFLNIEDRIPIARESEGEDDFGLAISCAWDEWEGTENERNVLSVRDGTQAGDLQEAAKGSARKFVKAAYELQKEAEFLRNDDGPFLKKSGVGDLLQVLSVETSDIAIKLRSESANSCTPTENQ